MGLLARQTGPAAPTHVLRGACLPWEKVASSVLMFTTRFLSVRPFSESFFVDFIAATVEFEKGMKVQTYVHLEGPRKSSNQSGSASA